MVDLRSPGFGAHRTACLRWVAVENIAFGVAKLALLPACIAVTANARHLLGLDDAGHLAAIAAVTWYLFARRIPEHMSTDSTDRELLPTTRELIVLAGAQYACVLSSVLMPSLMTLIVINRLGPVANAYYFLPAMIASGLGLFCWSVVRSFLVEAAQRARGVRRHANSAIRALALVVVPSVVLGLIFAPILLEDLRLGVLDLWHDADASAVTRAARARRSWRSTAPSRGSTSASGG